MSIIFKNIQLFFRSIGPFEENSINFTIYLSNYRVLIRVSWAYLYRIKNISNAANYLISLSINVYTIYVLFNYNQLLRYLNLFIINLKNFDFPVNSVAYPLNLFIFRWRLFWNGSISLIRRILKKNRLIFVNLEFGSELSIPEFKYLLLLDLISLQALSIVGMENMEIFADIFFINFEIFKFNICVSVDTLLEDFRN
jgi:hypothetical protein